MYNSLRLFVSKHDCTYIYRTVYDRTQNSSNCGTQKHRYSHATKKRHYSHAATSLQPRSDVTTATQQRHYRVSAAVQQRQHSDVSAINAWHIALTERVLRDVSGHKKYNVQVRLYIHSLQIKQRWVRKHEPSVWLLLRRDWNRRHRLVNMTSYRFLTPPWSP